MCGAISAMESTRHHSHVKEIDRYQVPESDVWLIRTSNVDKHEQVWIYLDPPPPGEFVPSDRAECFIVASSSEQFAGLKNLILALAFFSEKIGVADVLTYQTISTEN